MAENAHISHVSDTSFWVAHYRVLESGRPDALFKDPYAQMLVGDLGKKISDAMTEVSRYTQWSVVSRTVMIDRFVEKFIGEGVDAIINLGAGLDARPYRMNLPPNLEWVEADYLHIIQHKTEVLKNETPKCRLTRVAVDLANRKKREEFLNQVVPQAKKVLILTEGVLPYLTPDQVSSLAADLLKQKRFCFWVAEYFHESVYRYLKTAAQRMKNAPFQFFPDNWFAFFEAVGWVKKEIRYGAEIAAEFNRKAPMPKWAWIVMPFIPGKKKEEFKRMSGYVVFERKII